MIRREAIELISKKIGKQPIVAANGFISRDLFETTDKESNFYMIGSMGLSSSIGLGIAIKNPKKRVYVFDGDGNILMNMGSMTTIGFLRPGNLIHVIFDNRVHESTGSQPTHTSKIDIAKIAKASNYTVFKVNSKKTLQKTISKIKNKKGPICLLVRVEKSNYVSKRVSITPPKIRDRFINFLKN